MWHWILLFQIMAANVLAPRKGLREEASRMTSKVLLENSQSMKIRKALTKDKGPERLNRKTVRRWISTSNCHSLTIFPVQIKPNPKRMARPWPNRQEIILLRIWQDHESYRWVLVNKSYTKNNRGRNSTKLLLICWQHFRNYKLIDKLISLSPKSIKCRGKLARLNKAAETLKVAFWPALWTNSK